MATNYTPAPVPASYQPNYQPANGKPVYVSPSGQKLVSGGVSQQQKTTTSYNPATLVSEQKPNVSKDIPTSPPAPASYGKTFSSQVTKPTQVLPDNAIASSVQGGYLYTQPIATAKDGGTIYQIRQSENKYGGLTKEQLVAQYNPSNSFLGNLALATAPVKTPVGTYPSALPLLASTFTGNLKRDYAQIKQDAVVSLYESGRGIETARQRGNKALAGEYVSQYLALPTTQYGLSLVGGIGIGAGTKIIGGSIAESIPIGLKVNPFTVNLARGVASATPYVASTIGGSGAIITENYYGSKFVTLKGTPYDTTSAKASIVANDLTNLVTGGIGFNEGLKVPIGYGVARSQGVELGKGFVVGKNVVIGKVNPENYALASKESGALGLRPYNFVESALFKKYVSTLPSVESQYLGSSLELASGTYGVRSKIYNPDVLGQSKVFQELNPSAQTEVRSFLKEQKDILARPTYEVYGSTSTKAQNINYRVAKDIDIQFTKDSASSKAQELVTRLQAKGTPSRIVGESQVEVNIKGNWNKLADIHGFDTIKQIESPKAEQFGFKRLPSQKIGGVQSSQLSQEGINKLGSVTSLRPSATGEPILSPEPVRRMKDVADFYSIQKELVSRKLIGKSSLNKALETYKATSIEKFGANVYKDYPNEIISYSSSKPSSSSASVKLLSASPSLSKRSSLSISPSKSLSLSVSPSISSSVSPSISKSPSSSLKISGSVSPSLSRSISPSLSSSLSISPSISPSLSKSVSRSISRSYSPSSSSSYIPPLIPGLGGLEFSMPSRIIKGGKFKPKYTPSFSAVAFNIYGRYRRTGLSRSGLDFRPLGKRRRDLLAF